jgi:hypothetical protein
MQVCFILCSGSCNSIITCICFIYFVIYTKVIYIKRLRLEDGNYVIWLYYRVSFYNICYESYFFLFVKGGTGCSGVLVDKKGKRN